MHSVTAWVPTGLSDIRPGMDLGALIVDLLHRNDLTPEDRDVLVIAHKVVSKAEGAVVHLTEIDPGPAAVALAVEAQKDPRLCQVIIDESHAVLRVRPGLIIAEHRLGFICANAGVDFSNVGLGEEWVATLPKEPHVSAERLRRAILEEFGASVAVIVNDTHGRPWREGAVGVAIGVAGLEPLLSHVGREDLYGYVLHSSIEGIADELAATASLLQGQAAEGTPLVLIRGARFDLAAAAGRTKLLREADKDLFR